MNLFGMLFGAKSRRRSRGRRSRSRGRAGRRSRGRAGRRSRSRGRRSRSRGRRSRSRERRSRSRGRRSRSRGRRSRSRGRAGRPKDMNKYKSERGCTVQTTKKYKSRPSPPYPANLCRGKEMQGNDGKVYKSVRAKKEGEAYYKWKKI